MKVLSTILVLFLSSSLAAGQASGCSEALAAFSSCAISLCPDFDQRCDPLEDADTCPQVEASCQGFHACCGGCGGEIEDILATCALGACTATGISCTGSPAATAGFAGCSEATTALSQCILANCPEDADVVCDPNLADADTCSDVETACQGFTSCCSGQCGPEVKGILATCGLGVCPDISC